MPSVLGSDLALLAMALAGLSFTAIAIVRDVLRMPRAPRERAATP